MIKVLENTKEPYTAERITGEITNRKGPTARQVMGILRRLVGRGRVTRIQEVPWKASEYMLRCENG